MTTTAQTVEVPRYLSPKEVCEWIPGMTIRTLEQQRYRRRAGEKGAKAGPPFTSVSRTAVVYDAADVVAHIRAIRK